MRSSWLIAAALHFAACGDDDDGTLFEGTAINALSTDGTYFYFDVEGRVYRLDKEGGDPAVLIDESDPSKFAQETATDGTDLFVLQRSGNLEAIHTGGANRRVVFADDRRKFSLRLDAAHVLWADQQLPALAVWGIRSVPKLGGSASWVYITQGNDAIDAMDLSSAEAYFITHETTGLNAISSDGTGTLRVVTRFDHPMATLVIRGETAFVADPKGVVREISPGGESRVIYDQPGVFRGALAADAGALYIGFATTPTVAGYIDRIPLDGGATRRLLDAQDPQLFLTDEDSLYFVDPTPAGFALKRTDK